MPRRDRSDREEEIETAAYQLLEQRGFAGTGMQAIALAARASNETLYRWYGDKIGLFRALISRNAEIVAAEIRVARQKGDHGLDALDRAGSVLLAMLLGNRAIALNRAAAADPTGELGRTLCESDRNVVTPLIGQLMAEAMQLGQIAGRPCDSAVTPQDLAELWLTLLIGDLRIRCVTGDIPALPDDEVRTRSRLARERLLRVYPSH